MTKRMVVVGAGWSGAVVARSLHEAGFRVEVFERAPHVGGHSRSEMLNGVLYEPNGAHIFHTSNPEVADYVQRLGISRPYEHKVVTEVYLDDDEGPTRLSWPPQLAELRNLRIWPTIRDELDKLASHPSGDDFETYVVSMMGPTLYSLFVRDYTVKQWGRSPTELSSSLAPKRVEVRDDGNRRLFRDRWEFFPEAGVNSAIEAVLTPVPTTCGVEVDLNTLEDLGGNFDAVVVTTPLDDFVMRPNQLAWRGISMRSRYVPTESEDASITAAYVVNQPSPRFAYTRTVETKQATGQRICGTVVSEEYPGSPARHYPVPTVGRTYDHQNEALKDEIRSAAPLPVFFCGRLANYSYINQDQAIEQALDLARKLVREHA